ncbi:adenosylcobinamide-GDP ribazoletransferase [Hyphomicrobium sp.]|uniref:adenosylcobinamide-GDP ribazoletransferase n=1 Tax=Hyphomicrobium sp. TaxID=82 RepID=UPI002D790BD1|nr:adenosylcobinamide-GDP ribazoletransferase [Hyphomicrobium sp.]HET6390499.1 adenosylcobinamide-GDP ribazoletransferase [Hyphomicrobium sp.]
MISLESMRFFVALQFLTRIPLKHIDPLPRDWLARAAKYLPLVGGLIGIATGGVILLASYVFPWPLPVILGLGFAILLTGALHEDGLADTADAFGGGHTRERCLEIMKDSRIGTYGVLALIITLALKATALAHVSAATAAAIVIAGFAGARLAPVLALAALPYGGGEAAKVSRTASDMTRNELGVAVGTGLIFGLIFLNPLVFLASTLFAGVAAALVALIAQQKIGGYTGDVLGAIEQVYETVFFIMAVAIISGPG